MPSLKPLLWLQGRRASIRCPSSIHARVHGRMLHRRRASTAIPDLPLVLLAISAIPCPTLVRQAILLVGTARCRILISSRTPALLLPMPMLVLVLSTVGPALQFLVRDREQIVLIITIIIPIDMQWRLPV